MPMRVTRSRPRPVLGASVRLALLACVSCLAACGRIRFDPTPVDGATGAVDAVAVPWQLVQVGSIPFANTLAIQPTAAGDLLVACINNGGTVTSVDGTPGVAFTEIPESRPSDATGLVDLWYAANVPAGVNMISVAGSVQPSGIVVWEVANIRLTNPLDTATSATKQVATALLPGPTIRTTVAGEFVVSAMIFDFSVFGTHAGNEFTNDATPDGDGFAHLTDPGAAAGMHQAMWDASNMQGNYWTDAAAFLPAP
jgi:hypothetical protein